MNSASWAPVQEKKRWRGCHLLVRDHGSRGGRIRDLKPGCAENQNSGSFPNAWFSAVSLGLSPPRGHAPSPSALSPALGTRRLSLGGGGAVFLLPSPPFPSPPYLSPPLPSPSLASPPLASPSAPRSKSLHSSPSGGAVSASRPPPRRELRAGTLQRQEVNRAPGGGEAKERPGGDGRAAVGAGARARPAVGPAGTAVVLAAPRGGCRRLPWFFRHSGLKCLPVLLEAGSSPLNPSFFFLSAGDRRLRGGGGRGLGGGGVSEKGTGPAGWGGGGSEPA